MIPRPLMIATALLLAFPVAAASWSYAGSFEPSTPYDDASLMFQDAPQTPGKKVYFNAYSVTSTLVTATSFSLVRVNPNVAQLHTQNEPPAAEYHEALLGVWTDCNKDGYVGMAEGAMREYEAALLFDTQLCPPSSGPIDRWDGAHNYNGLVTELIPIHRFPNLNDTRRYVDIDARVWGDFHRPDELPFARTCALAPQPRGTYQSTGGALNYFDCRADVLEGFNVVVDTVGDPAGLRFADDDDGRTGALGKIGTFGTEDSSKSAVTVWDCSAPALVRVGTVLNDTAPQHLQPLTPEQRNALWGVHNTQVYTPSDDPVGNTNDPTVPGTVNHTVEGLPVSLVGVGDGSSDSDCNTADDRGDDFYGNRYTFYVGEEDFSGVDPKNKKQANWNLAPTNTTRGRPTACVFVTTCTPRVGPTQDGPSGHDENTLGLNPGTSGVRWVSPSIQATKPGPSLVRSSAGGFELAGGYWLTFYASLGPASTDKLEVPGKGGTYGSWHCGANRDGIHNGWNCDPAAWYINPDGSPMPDFGGYLARPGQAYTLRDVDCYDGSNDLGIATGAPAYGADPCP